MKNMESTVSECIGCCNHDSCSVSLGWGVRWIAEAIFFYVLVVDMVYFNGGCSAQHLHIPNYKLIICIYSNTAIVPTEILICSLPHVYILVSKYYQGTNLSSKIL